MVKSSKIMYLFTYITARRTVKVKALLKMSSKTRTSIRKQNRLIVSSPAATLRKLYLIPFTSITTSNIAVLFCRPLQLHLANGAC